MRLRSRLERPGRSHTSPKRTFSVRSMSFGTTDRSFSRAADADDVAIGSSFYIQVKNSCASRRFIKRGVSPFQLYPDSLGQGSLAQLVELHGAFGQHLTPVSLRELLSNHGWSPREKSVGMRIVGGPQNLVRTEVLGQMRQAALHRFKGNPALPLEILAGPHAQWGIVEEALIVKVPVHAI